ncbi:MAG: patatin-like phospholipase family protein [Caldilineaceae bacterium]|nr:patatin-like phospholipase family protein [Caldilineaceae bacterium]
MRAFVLSGGGNLGPVQVGALRALFEASIYPTMIVGCSAGALNAAYLARHVSDQQLDELAGIWRSVTAHDVYPGHRLLALWRLLSGQDSLYDNRNFYAFLQRHGTTPAHTFAQVTAVRLYVTATNLRTGRLHVFGDNPHDRILDALMASTALTPLHPPWEVDGESYIDGGTITPLPLRVALERGATEIFSLHIEATDQMAEERVRDSSRRLIRGVAAVMTRSVSTMLQLQAQHDLTLLERRKWVKLHHIRLAVANPPPPNDFSQVEELIASGYATTKAYLAQRHQRLKLPPSMPLPWQHLSERWLHFPPRKATSSLP